MEVETMLEDDVFFAELSKRISLLITDDDDDFAAAAQFIPAAPLPGFASTRAHVPSQQQHQHRHSQGGGASLLAPPPYALLYHHGASYGGGDSGAAWLQQQCGSKGTGVFIPRSTPGGAHPRKKGKGSRAAAKAAAREGGNALAAGAPTKKRGAA